MQHLSSSTMPGMSMPMMSASMRTATLQVLSQFDKEIDGLVYLYLLSNAQDGKVCRSGYAMARQLGLYRVSLSRIMQRLQQQNAITVKTVIADNGEVKHMVTFLSNPFSPSAENVTFETEDVAPEPEQPSAGNSIEKFDSKINQKLAFEQCPKPCVVTPEPEQPSAGNSIEKFDSKINQKSTFEQCPKTCDVTSDSANVTPHSENVTFEPEDVTPESTNVTSLSDNSGGDDAMPDDELVDKKKNKKENSPDTPKEKNKIKNPHKHARAKTETLEQRRQDFIGQLEPFADIYGREMTDAFANYWTEPNRSLSRMRFELQRTWCLSMRLATWARNEKKFFHQPIGFQRPSPADNVAQAQQWAIEESERVVREAEQARELRRQMLVAQGLISDHGGQGTQMLLPF